MASLSVKDRAKMFGNLASPSDPNKDRSYRRIGNKVSSSPFRSTPSPKTVPVNAKFPPSPFSSSSPTAFSATLPTPKDKKSTGFPHLRTSSPREKNNMDWPDEDGIPAPDTSKNDITSIEQNVAPMALPRSKFSNSPSPFKVLKNEDNGGRLRNIDSSSSKVEAGKQLFKPQSYTMTIPSNNLKKFQSKIVETNGEKKNSVITTTTPTGFEESPQDPSTSNHNENKLPTNGSNRGKSTRAMRLAKARRASPSPIVSKNLKQSLQAAKVILQEEKSDTGASDTSSRSSLTNKELSDIAKRALNNSRSLLMNEKNTNVSSNVEIKQALLNVTASKQKRVVEGNAASERLGVKASRVVAMKNSTKSKVGESTKIGVETRKSSSTNSNDLSKSRRMEHPAFASRSAKTGASSDDILASFRQFNAGRLNLPSTHKQVDKIFTTNQRKGFDDEMEQTFSDDDSLRSRTSVASLEQEETMHSISEMVGESMHSINEIPGESMRSMSERRGESMHSMSERLGRSGRKHADHFYRMGKIHVTSKNNCNDTVISSLSGNTHSCQSIMSQSIASKMKSPANKKAQKNSFLLDPMPEHSSQTHKSELVAMISPGPSNRSSHSFANSIISASPRADYRSPSLRDRVNAAFLDTLEEKHSISQESAGNSAELLDAALEAAIEDMEILDSPIRNPSICVEGNKIVGQDNDCRSNGISILPSSSGRSHSPPGFVFKDTEESDILVPPGPVDNNFEPTNTIVGEVDNLKSNSLNERIESSDASNDPRIKQEISEVDELEGVSHQTKDVVYQKQGSTSTKRTVSTSIRSGISSIQNGSNLEIVDSDPVFESVGRDTYEGSSSIRTGLSGLQSQKDSNDMDNSISIHTNKNAIFQNEETNNTSSSEDKETTENVEPERSLNLLPKAVPPQYPDTIQEENEVKSTQKSVMSIQKSVMSAKDENNSLSGLKVKSTATTDGSSGTTTAASSTLDHVLSDPSGNKDEVGVGIRNTNENVLPPIETEEGDGEDVSQNGFSLLSPGSRSSRPWKNSFGKSIGNAIKTVLAKASPRGSGHASSTPSGQNKRRDSEECESLFSLDDDDDDIFGGLEVEKNDKPSTPRKQKIDLKTPKLKNFKTDEKKDVSSSRRTNESLSRRTNESFSRRTNRSLSRRTNESVSRKSNGTGSNRKMHMNIKTPSNAGKKTPNTPSQPHKRSESSPSATPVINTASLYSNDRSGTIVEESEVVHNVNSDITSSLIGGPISGPSPFQKAMREASKFIERGQQQDNEMETQKKDPETQFLKEDTGESFTLLMEEPVTSLVPSLNQDESQPKEQDPMEEEEEDKQPSSMFMNFGCGLVDPCSRLASLCTQGNNIDDDAVEDTVIGDAGGDKDSASVSSRSQLTSLEKKVWNEWDRLNDSVISPNNTNQSTIDEKKNDFDRNREAARDKLLDIASTALSSQMSTKSGKSTLIEDDQCTKTTFTDGQTVSASGSTESEFTKDSESGASTNSFGNSLTESGDSLGSYTQDSTQGYSTSYTSGEESYTVLSEDPSRSSNTKSITPTASPILLSFSQRSLMEKFSKQLTAVGVQVLKLNTRKQWQTRYFTVSSEQIALSAHEAVSKTGEIAQCPKALLWLKKFNPKNGGYGIVNIDKNGHGGMLLVDLIDIQVSDRKDDMLGNPIPRKLLDAFENSVLVTLKYKMKGILRSIEFRCRDNDEAQFLCTCMRVIRDLLRRERSLRQKLSKEVINKKEPSATLSSSRGK